MPTYHGLHITTQRIPRTSIFNLPYGYEVSCSRVTGWTLEFYEERLHKKRLVAGEYDWHWLVLDVDGVVICDARERHKEDMEEPDFLEHKKTCDLCSNPNSGNMTQLVDGSWVPAEPLPFYYGAIPRVLRKLTGGRWPR